MLLNALGNEEFRVFGPAKGPFGKANFFFAKRLTMGGCSVLLVRRAVADVAVQNDESRAAFGFLKYAESALDQIDVIGVADPQHIPSVPQKPGGNILRESNVRTALDRDVVIVVDPAQVIETEMPRQRRGLRCDAFHHAAVPADRIRLVVENLEARTVVTADQPFLRNSHSDTGGDALPEGTRRCFDTGHPVIFRMSWRLAVELTKAA